MRRWLLFLFCLIVAYLTLFYQLGNLAFVGADEPRYARIGEEMVLRGSYVTPTLNFHPWLEKPPLLFWLEAASFRVFGVHEWAARLPVALLAALTTMAASVFAFKLRGSRGALLTALILTTSGLFFVFARAASTDMPLTAMLTAAMVSAFLATSQKGILWGAGAGGALALAVLAKGPVAVVIFGGVFLFYCLLIQKQPWNWKQSALGVVVFLAVALPWFWRVWLENGSNFVATFWLNHHLARFISGLHHHSQPFWYYLLILLIGFFPWVFFLTSAAARLWQDRQRMAEEGRRAQLFLWLWVVIPLLFFSLSESKLAGYILPVFPALAVIVALEWDRYLERDPISSRAMGGQLMALVGCAFLLALALPLGFHFHYRSAATGGLLSVPILAGVLWAGYEFRRQRPVPSFLALAAGMAIFAAFAFWRAAPVVGDYHSARDLSKLSRSFVSKEEPLILYRYFHHTAQYYTGYRTTQESLPDLQSLQDYLVAHPQTHYYLLTQEAGWQDLKSFPASHLIQVEGNLYLLKIIARQGRSGLGATKRSSPNSRFSLFGEPDFLTILNLAALPLFG